MKNILAREGSWDAGDAILPEAPNIVDWSFDQHVLTCPVIELSTHRDTNSLLHKLIDLYCPNPPIEEHQRVRLSSKWIADPTLMAIVTDSQIALSVDYKTTSLTWETVTMQGIAQAHPNLQLLTE